MLDLQGCGFATFALKEDAKRAIEVLNGKSLGGRTIQVIDNMLSAHLSSIFQVLPPTASKGA
jgi:RNA recognition motif-containing protein